MHKEWYDYDPTLGECTTCGDTPCTCPPGTIWLRAGGRHTGVCTHRGGHQPFCKGVIYANCLWSSLPITPSNLYGPQPGDVCAECGCLWSAHAPDKNHCYNCTNCKVFSDTHLPHAGAGIRVFKASSYKLVHEIPDEETKWILGPAKATAPSCECGATKCGSSIHSTWCPLHK